MAGIAFGIGKQEIDQNVCGKLSSQPTISIKDNNFNTIVKFKIVSKVLNLNTDQSSAKWPVLLPYVSQ